MPADVWPTFWACVSNLINNGSIYSSIKVKDEIDHGNDELTTWMRNNTTQDFYIPLDADVADAYLVATAAAKNMTLVTYETSDPTCRRKVKIPDACIAIGVRYCDLNTALRELGVKI